MTQKEQNLRLSDVAEICFGTSMSYENAAGQITGPVVRSLDGIPEAGLRPIPRVPTSYPSTASQQSSRSGRLLGRGERCFLTKTICYTHEQAHFLNAVRHASGSGRKEDIVSQMASILIQTTKTFQQENIIRDLGVVSEDFDLDSPENLVNRVYIFFCCFVSCFFIS